MHPFPISRGTPLPHPAPPHTSHTSPARAGGIPTPRTSWVTAALETAQEPLSFPPAAAHQLMVRRRQGQVTWLLPRAHSPQTCHPPRLPLLCPCHHLMLRRLWKSPGALHQEDVMWSWAEITSKRPAAPHSSGIPESPDSGASPQHNHTGLSPTL